MKPYVLYAVPFACSLAVHLVLAQHDIPFTLRWVRRGSRRQIQDEELALVNPKRKVATLVTPSGEVLTENVGILYHLDEQQHPTRASAERRRLLEWLTFLSTELHKQVLAVAYDAEAPAAAKDDARDRLLPAVLDHLETTLATRATLVGDTPSGADAFAFWGLLLLRNLWPESVATPALTDYRRRMRALPFAARVLEHETKALAENS